MSVHRTSSRQHRYPLDAASVATSWASDGGQIHTDLEMSRVRPGRARAGLSLHNQAMTWGPLSFIHESYAMVRGQETDGSAKIS
ncbi:hypothetical protein NDU88_004941 [Pleurodeles waltl]|uniref:Uncharacterized protein n=1 Tax=Pleurodeles waltl TaxID=8319 RepID=A0AAV7VJN1_PLEWA|nr:hypothetical protein NDU88_004941 [Pleurodeles waltl]